MLHDTSSRPRRAVGASALFLGMMDVVQDEGMQGVMAFVNVWYSDG